MRTSTLAAVLGLFVFLADQISKYFTQQMIPLMGGYYPYRGIPVFQDFFGIEFSIVHATNRGAAWGMFAEYQDWLMGLRIILIAALILYLLFFHRRGSYTIPLTLITVGAFCNIIDYFLYGHVIDMFHFVLWGYDFPVFNIADSAICIGVFWLFIVSWNTE